MSPNIFKKFTSCHSPCAWSWQSRATTSLEMMFTARVKAEDTKKLPGSAITETPVEGGKYRSTIDMTAPLICQRDGNDLHLMPHVFLAVASCKVKKDADQFQLSLRATEATSDVQDFHVEANFLLRQTKACKCATKKKKNTRMWTPIFPIFKTLKTKSKTLTHQQGKNLFYITYSHIKDTTGIRYGVNIRLVVLTGARNMRPGGGKHWLFKHWSLHVDFIL